MGPDVDTYDGGPNQMLHIMSDNFDKANQQVVNDLRSHIPKIEVLVNNDLPDGFYCKVEE